MRGAPILIEEVEVDYPAERRSLRTILRGITLAPRYGVPVSVERRPPAARTTIAAAAR